MTPPPSGLLRLEELVQSFLISRETLSVRMLDQNLDPTPLLKEIRDDQVATIIIDANASLSYRILKKVRTTTGHSHHSHGDQVGGGPCSHLSLWPQANQLGMMSSFYTYILTTMVSWAGLGVCVSVWV